MSLLEVKNLHTYFKTKKGIVKAVNDVTYSLDAGKTLGIVGESGSGKSVSAMSIIKLLDGNGYIESGDVKPLAVFSDKRMDAYPDIPAFTETVPEAEKYLNIPYTLLSFVVNNDTPQEVVDVLKAASEKVFADPEWTDFVKQNAADPVYDEYKDDASIQAFYDNWKSVICWLQYDNGVAEKSPEEFGIKRIGE